MLNKVTCGNCLDLMRELPDNSIDSVITDPPYGLSNHSTEDVSECLACWIKGEPYTQSKKGFMGKEWDGWVPGPEVWKECYRVLKPGGTILCFAGSRTQDLMGMALRLSGFEISDAIVYHFGSGFPKSHNIGKSIDKLRGNDRDAIGVSKGKGYSSIQEKNIEQDNRPYVAGLPYERADRTLTKGNSEWEGYGTALKPSYEIILMGRKPCDGTFAQNAEKWNIAGLNIDGTRIGTNPGYKYNADKNGTTFHGQQGERIKQTSEKKGSDTIESTQGRWPANTILSCACEGEHAEDCPVRIMDEQSNGASRFFYCAKPSRAEKEAGLEGFEGLSAAERTGRKEGSAGLIMDGGKANPYAGNTADRVQTNSHPTCKPISLMRYLCKLTRPPHGGIVLDPFTGSGTTGIAAILEDRDFIGFELSQEYTEIANARIEHHAKQEDLCLSI